MKNYTMIKLRDNRTQKEIANELDIPVSTYAMIENGYRFPRKDLQMKLSRFFEVTVDELFFNKIDHNSRSKDAEFAKEVI